MMNLIWNEEQRNYSYKGSKQTVFCLIYQWSCLTWTAIAHGLWKLQVLTWILLNDNYTDEITAIRTNECTYI